MANQIFRKERLQRKKHMDVCRHLGDLTRAKMARFRGTMRTCMARKSQHAAPFLESDALGLTKIPMKRTIYYEQVESISRMQGYFTIQKSSNVTPILIF